MPNSTKKVSTYSYSVVHNVDGLNGFFILNNREHLCETLADAVSLADRFNEVTRSTAYAATATHHYASGGYNSTIVYKVIGVSPDGQPHGNCSFYEHPVAWITEEEYDALPEFGEGSRSELQRQHGGYFSFTPARQRAYYAEMSERLSAAKSTNTTTTEEAK